MHFYLKLANTNHIGILDVLLTETMLVITQNLCLLPLRSQIRQNRVEFGPRRIWAHHTGKPQLTLLLLRCNSIQTVALVKCSFDGIIDVARSTLLNSMQLLKKVQDDNVQSCSCNRRERERERESANNCNGCRRINTRRLSRSCEEISKTSIRRHLLSNTFPYQK